MRKNRFNSCTAWAASCIVAPECSSHTLFIGNKIYTTRMAIFSESVTPCRHHECTCKWFCFFSSAHHAQQRKQSREKQHRPIEIALTGLRANTHHNHSFGPNITIKKCERNAAAAVTAAAAAACEHSNRFHAYLAHKLCAGKLNPIPHPTIMPSAHACHTTVSANTSCYKKQLQCSRKQVQQKRRSPMLPM